MFFNFFVERDLLFFLGLLGFFFFDVLFTVLFLLFDVDDLLDGLDALFVGWKQVASGLFKLLDLIDHVIIIFKRIVFTF